MRSPCDLLNILLVEDKEGDARLAVEAFSESRIRNRVYHVRDGVEAMAFLRKQGEHADAPSPHLILLDLNMPRKDGREVLSEIKHDEALKMIPVIVLSISDGECEIDKTNKLRADSFFTKPIKFDQFLEVVRSIESFWLGNDKIT